MKKLKRSAAAAAVAAAAMSGLAFQSFAATVDLPQAFDNLAPILEIFLKIVEFISRIVSVFN